MALSSITSLTLDQYLAVHHALVAILDDSYNDEQRAENLLAKGLIDLKSPLFIHALGGNND